MKMIANLRGRLDALERSGVSDEPYWHAARAVEQVWRAQRFGIIDQAEAERQVANLPDPEQFVTLNVLKGREIARRALAKSHQSWTDAFVEWGKNVTDERRRQQKEDWDLFVERENEKERAREAELTAQNAERWGNRFAAMVPEWVRNSTRHVVERAAAYRAENNGGQHAG